MSGSRTERPTPRRLREARGRGEVAVSRELVGAAALLAGLAALWVGGGPLLEALAATLRSALAEAVLAGATARASDGAAPLGLLARAAATLLCTAGPALLASTAAGGLVGLLQTRFLFAPALARPELSRLDPAAGLRRLLSAAPWRSAALGVLRALLLLAASAWLAHRVAAQLLRLPRASLAALPAAWTGLVWPLAGELALLVGLAAVCDLLLVRRRREARLRMTREEVLREAREEDGEPRLREERRRVQRALASAPPLSRAAVLVVNPTHLAVALAHDLASDEAPKVVAKGAGPAAARLRALARRAGVPVVREVALARSLFQLAEVGDAIPEALYQAAAEVLVQLQRRRAGAGP